MAGFFGPGGLASGSESKPAWYTDLLARLTKDYPGIQGLGNQPPPSAMSGYAFPGIQFFNGQLSGGSPQNLSLFSTAGGQGESLTAQLAQGGKSQQPITPAASNPFNAAFPAAPQVQAAAFEDGGGTVSYGPLQSETTTSGGASIGDILGAAGKTAGVAGGVGELILGTSGQPFDPTGQMQSPAMQQQRTSERDYTNLTGSPSGTPQFSGMTFNETVQPPAGLPGMSADDIVRENLPPGGGAPVNVPNPTSAQMQAALGELGINTNLPPITAGAGVNIGNLLNAAGSAGLGVGGLAGLAGGVQGLVEGDSDNTIQSLLQIGSSGVQTYQAIQQLSTQFPELAKSLIGGELPTITQAITSLANGAGVPQAGELVQTIDSLVNGAQSAPGAVGGVTGNLSLGGAGAAAVAAILGIIAQQTGSKELGMAASALGAAASGVATAAAVSAAVSGAVSGIAGAAGAAFAPIAVALIAFSIANMISPDSAPDLSDIWTGGRSDPYVTFVPELMQNVGQQNTAFGVLGQALPYVQSKEELGQLINSYKNYVQTTTGIQFDDAQDNPYALDAIPGVGPRTHGQATTPTDFGPQQQALQKQIDAMLNVLPGERITTPYGQVVPAGQPEGGLTGEALRRLWQQFMNPNETGAPVLSRNVITGPEVGWTFGDGGTPGAFIGAPSEQRFALYQGADQRPDYRTAHDIAVGQGAGTVGQGVRWDPATGNMYYTWQGAGAAAPPKPSDYFQPSPYWQQTQDYMLQQSPQYQAMLAQIQGQAQAFDEYMQQVAAYQAQQNLPTSPDAFAPPTVLPGADLAQMFANFTPQQQQTYRGLNLSPELLEQIMGFKVS